MITAITGATGHVGASLVRTLLREGRTVRVLVRNDLRAVEGLALETVQGDVLDFDSLRKLFRGAKTVFHLAAKISIVGSEGGTVEKINTGGTRNVINACLECGVKRLVHFSSIHAFRLEPVDQVLDETRKLAVDEDDFPYDRSKAKAQMEALDAVKQGLEVVVLNPTGIIGPYDFKPSRMGEVLLDIYRNKFPALVDGGYDWVDSRDVAACALSAEKIGRSGESYLVSGHWHHICEVADIVGELYRIKTPSLALPVWLCTIPSYCTLAMAKLYNHTPKFTPYALKTIRHRTRISHEKAARELGYKPRPIRETVRDTLDWFRERGMLDAKR
jgi:dihydroflavonol-4-reductase